MFLIVLTSLKIGCSEVYRGDGPEGEMHRRTHRSSGEEGPGWEGMRNAAILPDLKQRLYSILKACQK